MSASASPSPSKRQRKYSAQATEPANSAIASTSEACPGVRLDVPGIRLAIVWGPPILFPDKSKACRSRVDLLWQVSTAHVEDWSTGLLFHGHGLRDDFERALSVAVIDEPPHRQPGLSTRSVVQTLKAEGLKPEDQEWQARVKQLVAKQGTVTVNCAIMLMLGAGELSAETLGQKFGVPSTSPSGMELVHTLLQWADRMNVRPWIASLLQDPDIHGQVQGWKTVVNLAQSLFSVDLPPIGTISNLTAEQQQPLKTLLEMCGPALPSLKLLSMGHHAIGAMAHLCGVSSGSEVHNILHDHARVKESVLLPRAGDENFFCRLCKRQLQFFWATSCAGDGLEDCWSCVSLVDNPEQHTLFHNLSKLDFENLERLFESYSTFRAPDYVQLPVHYALTDKPHLDRFLEHGLFPENTIPDIQHETQLVNVSLPEDLQLDLSPENRYPQHILPCTADRSSLLARVFDQLKKHYGLLAPWSAPANYEGAVLFVMPVCGTMKLTPPHLDYAGVCNAMLGVVDAATCTSKYEKPGALWAFFPLAVFGPDSEHKDVLERVMGSCELVGSLDIPVEGGTLLAAVHQGKPSAVWEAMKELLQIPGVFLILQEPGDVVWQGAGWAHAVVSWGRSIKVACDKIGWEDVPVMCQMRQLYAGKKMGKDPITEGAPQSQQGAIDLVGAAIRGSTSTAVPL